jgi:hypothetical protein
MAVRTKGIGIEAISTIRITEWRFVTPMWFAAQRTAKMKMTVQVQTAFQCPSHTGN